MVHYKLITVQQRGLGEPARLMFHFAKQSFEDMRLTADEVKAMKPKLPYGQLPLLEVDGTSIAQSYAIYRFLGRQFMLAGKDDVEAAQVDSLADHIKDVTSDIGVWFGQMFGVQLPDKDKFENEVLRPTLKRLNEAIRKALTESGSGFLAGSGPTWLDFYMTERLYTFHKAVPDAFVEFTDVLDYIQRFQALPEIKDYIQSRVDTAW
ncbi:Glutathione S-transferase 1 [Aphelenchoides avenae]|nr:Glutathione S-transferase 1 [Aphelenchus avenae]